jgi:hypothetical protein
MPDTDLLKIVIAMRMTASIDPCSSRHNTAVFENGIGIRLNLNPAVTPTRQAPLEASGWQLLGQSADKYSAATWPIGQPLATAPQWS